ATATPTAILVTSYLFFGLGFGMVNAPVTNSTVSGMPRSQAGVAAGVASTSRQIGSSRRDRCTGAGGQRLMGAVYGAPDRTPPHAGS
ncbi:MAG: hypothetical protein ACLQFR_05525, partial [Streptosporangiaceae bacterium]